MKKQLLFGLLLSCSLGANAQTYIPFPTSNARWTERQGVNDEAWPVFSIIGMKTGDTTISGLTYHKLYRSTDAVLDESEYCGGLREDGAKHVYFYDASSHTERMIYDFSVSVGDTIRNPAAGNTPVGIVDNIDSVSIAGVYHKRFNFRMLTSSAVWTGGAWIEGIGNTSLGGLTGSPMMQPTCDCGIKTVCANDGTGWVYHNPLYVSVDCEGILGTKDVNKSAATSVTVFPNPVVGFSRVHIKGNGQYTSLAIYDMQGRKILSIDISGKTEVLLSKADFVPGVYMYRLVGAVGSEVVGKIVVE